MIELKHVFFRRRSTRPRALQNPQEITFNSIVYGFAKLQFYGFGRRRRSNQKFASKWEVRIVTAHARKCRRTRSNIFFFQLNFDIFLVRILQSGRQPRSIRRTEKIFLAKNHFRVLCFDFRRSQIVTNFCHLEKKYSRKNVKQLTRQDKVVEQQQ